jgi:perosamine synthetase
MRVTLGTFNATPRMIDRIVRVLVGGRLSYGPESKELENEFAMLHNTHYGVLSNSGTSSLVVALQSLKEMHGWPDGSEVLIPAITFVATANAVLQCKMIPVPVDVHVFYYDMDPYLIDQHITSRTVAAIPVNVFGKPADLPTITQICAHRNLLVLEDSCESMHVAIANRPVGSWGEVGVFSFYMSHILTAGIGGVGITNNYDLARKMRSLVNHGLSLDNLPGPDRYDPAFLGRNFEFDTVGHSFRITELESALALEQLVTLPDVISARTRVADIYDDILSEFDDMLYLPRVRLNSTSSWMMYPLLMKEQDKSGIMRWLRGRDIEVRDLLPLINQPCYKGMFDTHKYPVALNLENRGLYIGCHPGITPEQQEYVAQAFRDYRRYHAS